MELLVESLKTDSLAGLWKWLLMNDVVVVEMVLMVVEVAFGLLRILVQNVGLRSEELLRRSVGLV
jgi:hypothetical protein